MLGPKSPAVQDLIQRRNVETANAFSPDTCKAEDTLKISCTIKSSQKLWQSCLSQIFFFFQLNLVVSPVTTELQSSQVHLAKETSYKTAES